MADFKKQDKAEPVKQEVKQEIKEVLVETKKIDTTTKPTTYEERAKIESEIEMIKVGKDPSGRWIWKRSDRITEQDKKQRQSMLEKIKKGIRI